MTVTLANEGAELSRLTGLIEDQLNQLGVTGAVVVMERHDGRSLYAGAFGDFTVDRITAIASASKWMTVATVMARVDEEVLSLDQPVAEFLPEFREGNKRQITLRQCMACTSGMRSVIPEIYNTDLDFDEVVKKIAAQDLKADPGTAMIYGGTGFHVAGRVAVVATGRTWHELFHQKIRDPLDMCDTVFGRRDPSDPANNLIPEPARNPWLGGGVVTTMTDYARFMRMMVNDGSLNGTRVLSAAAIREMRMDQSGSARIVSTIHPAQESHYSLGSWVERRDEDGLAHQIRDMGVWGWNPWVDYDRRYFAVFGVKDRLQRTWGLCKQIEAAMNRALDAQASS